MVLLTVPRTPKTQTMSSDHFNTADDECETRVVLQVHYEDPV